MSVDPILWQVARAPSPVKATAQPSNQGIIVGLIMAHDREVNKPSNNRQLREAPDLDSFMRLARTGSAPITEIPAIGPDQRLMYGAALGSIRTTRGDGTWTALDTGTLSQILSVESVDQAIYAGTDNGVILSSRDGGMQWTSVTALAPNIAIRDIKRIGGAWYVLGLQLGSLVQGALAVDKVTVYRSTNVQPTDLKPIRQIDPKVAIMLHQKTRAYSDAKNYYVMAGASAQKLDVASQTWTELDPGKDPNGFIASPQSSVLTAYRAMGAFSSLWISPDQGRTWIKRNTPSYPMDEVYFRSAQDGYATRWDTHAFSATLQFQHYAAGSDSWVTDGDAPIGCIRALRDREFAPRYCVTTGGSILRLKSGNWAVEFASD